MLPGIRLNLFLEFASIFFKILTVLLLTICIVNYPFVSDRPDPLYQSYRV